MIDGVEKVFGTPELLENILLAIIREHPPARYPPHDLFALRDVVLAQRVNRQWRATIADSIALQRALFFKPEDVGSIDPAKPPALPLQFPVPDGKKEHRANVLLQSRFGLEFLTSLDFSRNSGGDWRDILRRCDYCATHRRACRWALGERSPPCLACAELNRSCQFGYFPLEMLQVSMRDIEQYKDYDRRLEARFLYPEASWRKMLITQPPYELVFTEMGDFENGIDTTYRGLLIPSLPCSPSNKSTRSWIVHNRSGVRMDDIMSQIWTQPSPTSVRSALISTWELLKREEIEGIGS